MIPTTFSSLVIAVAFVAPGLLYEQGIERSLGYWRTSLPDRVLRFFCESLILQGVATPVTFLLWSSYFRSGFDRTRVNWVLYGAALGYVVVPLVLGYLVGWGVKRHPEAAWVGPLFGRDPAPRAWDYLFASSPRGYVRARLKLDGHWVAGTFAADSVSGRGGYASSVVGTDDLYLPTQVRCNNQTGELTLDEEGSPMPMRWGLIICRADVDVIEFQDWA